MGTNGREGLVSKVCYVDSSDTDSLAGKVLEFCLTIVSGN